MAYLSAEFLPGPHLANNLLNLGITEPMRAGDGGAGLDLDELLEQEEEPGLGNGGLGRLASCYLDSLATLEVPAIGYGIRYEFGIFDQVIKDGWQVEITDKWLRFGNPWEIARPEIAYEVKFGGHTEHVHRRAGPLPRALGPRDGGQGRGLRHAHPRLPRGHRATRCACGRPRPSSRSTSQPSTTAITTGAVEDKMQSENITKVLYPNDEIAAGQDPAPAAAVSSSSPARCRT